MGRKPLPRAELLKRAIQEYPELVLMPPLKYRNCKDCWFVEVTGVCPFTGEKPDKILSSVECITITKRWNRNALTSCAPLYSSDPVLQEMEQKWVITYSVGYVNHTVELSAKSIEQAVAKLSMMIPQASLTSIACKSEATEATE